MINKFIFITIEGFIWSITPFKFLFGRNTIKNHHLVNRFFWIIYLNPAAKQKNYLHTSVHCFKIYA